jgi:hypothetical protein
MISVLLTKLEGLSGGRRCNTLVLFVKLRPTQRPIHPVQEQRLIEGNFLDERSDTVKTKQLRDLRTASWSSMIVVDFFRRSLQRTNRTTERTWPAHVMSHDSIALALIERGRPPLGIGFASAKSLEDELEKGVRYPNQGLLRSYSWRQSARTSPAKKQSRLRPPPGEYSTQRTAQSFF